jgi:hypothetical protein
VRQLERDRQHVKAVHRHPTGSIGLIKLIAAGQPGASIKDPILSGRESRLEDISPVIVFAINPPGEVDQKLVKMRAKNFRSPTPRWPRSI